MGVFPREEGDKQGHPRGRWGVQDQEWWCEGGKGRAQSPSGKRKRSSEGDPGEEEGKEGVNSPGGTQRGP